MLTPDSSDQISRPNAAQLTAWLVTVDSNANRMGPEKSIAFVSSSASVSTDSLRGKKSVINPAWADGNRQQTSAFRAVALINKT